LPLSLVSPGWYRKDVGLLASLRPIAPKGTGGEIGIWRCLWISNKCEKCSWFFKWRRNCNRIFVPYNDARMKNHQRHSMIFVKLEIDTTKFKDWFSL
jgi:hypothetical protein